MKIASVFSIKIDSTLALIEAYKQLINKLGCDPTYILLYPSITYNIDEMVHKLKELAPNIPIHGATSCLGAMTHEGFHSESQRGIGLLGIADEKGCYGVGSASISTNPRQAGADAIKNAISAANRNGEPPALIWLTAVPGTEEEVLQGIQDVIGFQIPIVGGSSADNDVTGEWMQIANHQLLKDHIVVTAMYPSTRIHSSFHSGYTVTEHSGIVTRAEGRILHEIDHQPAAEVYNRWTNGILADEVKDFTIGGKVLDKTSLYPLGQQVGLMSNQYPYHRLLHPETVINQNALTLFANPEVGSEIILMEGSICSLVTRAGYVANSALDKGRISAEDVAGALVVYCAGCMLTVEDSMNNVVDNLNKALSDVPFLGTFTFGEQGCFVGGENRHGNLMISVVVFEK